MTQLPFDDAVVDSAAGLTGQILDEQARQIIREALTETLFVEAGAGTGKTRALVDRIVALVRSGLAIDRIAAITFTERAAAELRERVRNGLEDELSKSDGAAGAFQAALESLDRAQISTIHAFCQSIVRIYAAEAAVDPDFDVQDPLMTQRRIQESWRMYLELIGSDERARRDVDRLLSLGLRVDDLERLALDLAARGEVAEMLRANPFRVTEPSWPNLDGLPQRLNDLPYEGAPFDDTLRIRLVNLLGVVEALTARPEEEREEILAAGASAFDPEEKHKGTIRNWSGASVRDHVLATVQEVGDQLQTLLTGLRAAALAAVLPRIIAFVVSDEQARGREGRLTFDDLILRTRRLLVGNAAAAVSLRSRLQALLIDEFQDTDPMQVQIARAFAASPDTGRVESGRLFLVGDPKQSIYRFRRADMATYAQTRDSMTADGARLPQLTKNRRSQRVILDWVNAVFAQMIGNGSRPDIQPPYHPIEPDRDNRLRGPGVATFGEQQQVSARETRVIEALEIASICRQAVEEKWQVADRAGAVRDAASRDIAILLPRRNGLAALERALSGAGIPFRVEGGSLIYRTQEIRNLVNILTAIDDPADEVAVVGALRSPAFACSDVDLARHRSAGHRFNYQHPKLSEWDGIVTAGLRTLAELHGVRHESSLAALTERVIFDCGLIETAILDQADRNSYRRARFMIERARAFESAGPESLRAFVQWLEQQSSAAMLDNEGAGLDDDEDAVRILTVHGAKGLEFPIAILAGMAAQPNFSQPATYSTDYAGERIAICIGPKSQNRRFTLGDFDGLNAMEADHTRAEFDRMLYVATTRARDHLIVSLHHHKRSNGSTAQRFIDCGADSTTRLAVSQAILKASPPQLDSLPVDLPAVATKESFAAERAGLLERGKAVWYTSATALAPHEVEQKEETTDVTEPWARGRGGTRLGRAVHAAIQSLPLDADDATIAAFAHAQSVAEAIPQRRRDVERLVSWVVRKSEAWQRARTAARTMREVPFALQSDGKVLEGFVDMVIQTEDGIEIVDWKTDHVSAADVPQRLQQYELQAGLYVHGLESATGIRVRRVTYVFAGAGVEASPGNPGALANAAREVLAAS